MYRTLIGACNPIPIPLFTTSGSAGGGYAYDQVLYESMGGSIYPAYSWLGLISTTFHVFPSAVSQHKKNTPLCHAQRSC